MAGSGLKAAARVAIADLMLGLCAAGLALIGAGFLLLTGFWALSRELGPIQAAGLTGLGLFMLAAVVLLIRRARRMQPAPIAAAIRQPVLTEPPGAAVSDPAVMAVFVLGFVLSRHFLQRR